MKHVFILLSPILFFFLSCDKDDEIENIYSGVNEIAIPTNAPMGLAYDGEHLWYSDYDLHTLNKLSATGNILETLNLSNYNVTGFDFYNGYIWCIHDTTVLFDTNIFPYPYCCIYKFSKQGAKIDSILIIGSLPIIKPEYLGLTACDTALFISSEQGESSSLYRISFEKRAKYHLDYFYLAGLTMHNDTLYAIKKGYNYHDRIVFFDSDFEIVKPKAIDIYFTASDLAFVGSDLWVCDIDNNKLVKVATNN